MAMRFQDFVNSLISGAREDTVPLQRPNPVPSVAALAPPMPQPTQNINPMSLLGMQPPVQQNAPIMNPSQFGQMLGAITGQTAVPLATTVPYKPLPGLEYMAQTDPVVVDQPPAPVAPVATAPIDRQEEIQKAGDEEGWILVKVDAGVVYGEAQLSGQPYAAGLRDAIAKNPSGTFFVPKSYFITDQGELVLPAGVTLDQGSDQTYTTEEMMLLEATKEPARAMGDPTGAYWSILYYPELWPAIITSKKATDTYVPPEPAPAEVPEEGVLLAPPEGPAIIGPPAPVEAEEPVYVNTAMPIEKLQDYQTYEVIPGTGLSGYDLVVEYNRKVESGEIEGTPIVALGDHWVVVWDGGDQLKIVNEANIPEGWQQVMAGLSEQTIAESYEKSQEAKFPEKILDGVGYVGGKVGEGIEWLNEQSDKKAIEYGLNEYTRSTPVSDIFAFSSGDVKIWLSTHRDEAEDIFKNGYRLEDGTTVYGVDAVYEKYKKDKEGWNPILNIASEIVFDPTNLVPTLGAPVSVAGKVVTKLAGVAPDIERIVKAVQGAAEIATTTGATFNKAEEVLKAARLVAKSDDDIPRLVAEVYKILDKGGDVRSAIPVVRGLGQGIEKVGGAISKPEELLEWGIGKGVQHLVKDPLRVIGTVPTGAGRTLGDIFANSREYELGRLGEDVYSAGAEATLGRGNIYGDTDIPLGTQGPNIIPPSPPESVLSVREPLGVDELETALPGGQIARKNDDGSYTLMVQGTEAFTGRWQEVLRYSQIESSAQINDAMFSVYKTTLPDNRVVWAVTNKATKESIDAATPADAVRAMSTLQEGASVAPKRVGRIRDQTDYITDADDWNTYTTTDPNGMEIKSIINRLTLTDSAGNDVGSWHVAPQVVESRRAGVDRLTDEFQDRTVDRAAAMARIYPKETKQFFIEYERSVNSFKNGFGYGPMEAARKRVYPQYYEAMQRIMPTATGKGVGRTDGFISRKLPTPEEMAKRPFFDDISEQRTYEMLLEARHQIETNEIFIRAYGKKAPVAPHEFKRWSPGETADSYVDARNLISNDAPIPALYELAIFHPNDIVANQAKLMVQAQGVVREAMPDLNLDSLRSAYVNQLNRSKKIKGFVDPRATQTRQRTQDEIKASQAAQQLGLGAAPAEKQAPWNKFARETPPPATVAPAPAPVAAAAPAVPVHSSKVFAPTGSPAGSTLIQRSMHDRADIVAQNDIFTRGGFDNMDAQLRAISGDAVISSSEHNSVIRTTLDLNKKLPEFTPSGHHVDWHIEYPDAESMDEYLLLDIGDDLVVRSDTSRGRWFVENDEGTLIASFQEARELPEAIAAADAYLGSPSARAATPTDPAAAAPAPAAATPTDPAAPRPSGYVSGYTPEQKLDLNIAKSNLEEIRSSLRVGKSITQKEVAYAKSVEELRAIYDRLPWIGKRQSDKRDVFIEKFGQAVDRIDGKGIPLRSKYFIGPRKSELLSPLKKAGPTRTPQTREVISEEPIDELGTIGRRLQDETLSEEQRALYQQVQDAIDGAVESRFDARQVEVLFNGIKRKMSGKIPDEEVDAAVFETIDVLTDLDNVKHGRGTSASNDLLRSELGDIDVDGQQLRVKPDEMKPLTSEQKENIYRVFGERADELGIDLSGVPRGRSAAPNVTGLGVSKSIDPNDPLVINTTGAGGNKALTPEDPLVINTTGAGGNKAITPGDPLIPARPVISNAQAATPSPAAMASPGSGDMTREGWFGKRFKDAYIEKHTKMRADRNDWRRVDAYLYTPSERDSYERAFGAMISQDSMEVLHWRYKNGTMFGDRLLDLLRQGAAGREFTSREALMQFKRQQVLRASDEFMADRMSAKMKAVFDEKIVDYQKRFTRPDKTVTKLSYEEAYHEALLYAVRMGESTAAGRFWRKYTTAVRQMMLYNFIGGIRYASMQWGGNSLTLGVTGNGRLIGKYVGEADFQKVFKQYLATGEMPESEFRHALDAYGIRGQYGSVSGGVTAKWQEGVDIESNPIIRDLFRDRRILGKQVPDKVGDIWSTATAPFASKAIRFAANYGDVRAREILAVHMLDREMLVSRNAIRESMRKSMPNSITEPEFNRVFDALPQRAKSDQIRGAFDQYNAGWAERGARDWQNAMTVNVKKSRAEVERVFFGGDKNIDRTMRNWFTFHYWMSRSIPLYTKAMLDHPVMLYNFLKASNEIAENEDLSNSRTIRILNSVLGYSVFVSPLSMMATGLYFANDESWETEGKQAFLTWIERTPFQLLPGLAAALNTIGLYGNTRMPDAFGVRQVFRAVETTINAAMGVAEAGEGPFRIDFTEKGINRLRDVLNPILAAAIPGLEEQDFTTPAERDQNEIRGIIADLALERGLSLDDPAVLAAMSDPQSDLYQEAMKRFGLSDLLELGMRTIPGVSWLYPTTTYKATAERNELIGGAVDRGGEWTDEENQASFDKSVIYANDPEARNLIILNDQYRDIGGLEGAAAKRTYDKIKYGSGTDPIDSGDGIWYSNEELLAMSDADREALADSWADTYGYTDDIEQILADQDVFKQAHPEYAAYSDWAGSTRRYGEVEADETTGVLAAEGSPVAYWEALVREGNNPNATRWYNDLSEEQKADEGALASFEAYMAWKGVQKDYRDPEPLETNTSPPPAVPAGTVQFGLGTGASGFGNKPRGPSEDGILDAIATHQADLAVFNQAASDMLGQQINVDLLNPMARAAVIDVLGTKGYVYPEMGGYATDYLDWQAERVRMKQPSSIKDFVLWWQERNPSANMPSGGTSPSYSYSDVGVAPPKPVNYEAPPETAEYQSPPP